MSLKDFVYKKRREVRKRGVTKAAHGAVLEAMVKGSSFVAESRQRAVWDDDWDVCLVLDATRLDTWRKVAGEYDDGGSEWSLGSASPQWITKTFAEEYRDEWEDAAYVTGNPFSGRDPRDEERDWRWIRRPVYPLAERGLGYLDEVWRDCWGVDGIETVDPGMLTDRGMWAHQEHDRTIVHYMQPHVPFRSRPEWFSGWGGTDKFGKLQGEVDPWLRLRDEEFDTGEFMEAYEDNLRWVLSEVERWRTETDANILVTADHGNAKGEWGQWGHPPGSANPYIRKVPWCRLRGVGEPVDVDRPDNCPNVGENADDDIQDRLRHLGYK